MQSIERRRFLKMAARGTALGMAAAALPLAGLLEISAKDQLKFRAATGLPSSPLPAYASFVVEGNIDLVRGQGTVRKSLYAGAPNAMSNILFPGTERFVRLTAVERSGQTIRVTGIVDGEARLGPREARKVWIEINTAEKTAHADFLGRQLELTLRSSER